MTTPDDAFHVYDTTLRDGAQQEGLSLSVEDKLTIARHLDDLGVGFIEGGWPGSNPKDIAFFERAGSLGLSHALVTAFGSTRRADAAVEHFKRTVHFDGEVNVSRGVDDVQAVAVPFTGGGGGLDGDAALLLLLHEVGGGLAVVYLAGLVDLAGELENAFRGRGLAGIHVGEDTDVSVLG